MQQLGRPDGIGAVGMRLAQMLAMGGQKDQALQVLDQAENAFDKLGASDVVEQVSRLRALITR